MSEQLSVVLEMDVATAAELRAAEIAERMLENWTIDCADLAEAASVEVRKVIGQIAAIKAKKAEFVKPAKAIIASAEGLFDPGIAALDRYQRGLKAQLLTWQQEQERIAMEARRKAEAEERERRQKAEREAAAARAKAEQEAAEQRRIAREAEEARQKAEREGNAREAARAAAQAAAASAKAAATVENAEAKATELVLAAESAMPVFEAPKKVAGFSSRDNWCSEFTEGVDESSILPMLVSAITGVKPAQFVRADLLALMKFDASASHKLAKALKGAMAVPGLRAANRPIGASLAA